jgi:hypothetical protein
LTRFDPGYEGFATAVFVPLQANYADAVVFQVADCFFEWSDAVLQHVIVRDVHNGEPAVFQHGNVPALPPANRGPYIFLPLPDAGQDGFQVPENDIRLLQAAPHMSKNCVSSPYSSIELPTPYPNVIVYRRGTRPDGVYPDLVSSGQPG